LTRRVGLWTGIQTLQIPDTQQRCYPFKPHFRLQHIIISFLQIAPACRTNKENKLNTARTSLTSSSRVLDNGQVLGWNLGPHTSYSDWEYTLFSSVLQENPGMVGFHNPVTTISIYISSNSLSRLALDAIQSVLLAAKINAQWINNNKTKTAFHSQSHTSTNLYVSFTASNTTNKHFVWRRDDRFLYTRLPAEREIVPDPHSRR